MSIYQQNLHHAQKLQKQANNKSVKPYSYALDKKIWSTSKYIKTKQNQKLKAKFFRLFQFLYIVGKQTYKLELYTQQKIHDVFSKLLQKQNSIKMRHVKKLLEIESKPELDKKKIISMRLRHSRIGLYTLRLQKMNYPSHSIQYLQKAYQNIRIPRSQSQPLFLFGR